MPEVTKEDINDLKEEDKTLHDRISKSNDQKREDFKDVNNKLDGVKDSVADLLKPMGAMAAQVESATKQVYILWGVLIVQGLIAVGLKMAGVV